MAAVLSKRQMTEEDIKLQFITPAITKKWGLVLLQWRQELQMDKST